MDYYEIDICGITRRLPLIQVSKKTRLARLSILGDVELVNVCADRLAERLNGMIFDHLIAPAVAVLPLVHGVALRMGHKRYVVCRKSVRPYMVKPVILQPQKHFPKHVDKLVVNGEDANAIRGTRVVILDDVVSTGVTMRMMAKMVEKIGAEVAGKAAVLRQGDQFDNLEDLIYLEELPVFTDGE